MSFVLQSHADRNTAAVLKAAVNEWELTAVVADNAKNMEVAATSESGLDLHVRCLVLTLNVATQAGLGVPQVSRITELCEKSCSFVSLPP